VSLVAISHTLGSLGEEIGRALASELGYAYADREIILGAAEQLGRNVGEFERLTEEAPTLLERLTEDRRDYLAAVEAAIWELAARDDVVFVGRGATFVLQRIRHVVRARITAPVHVRVRRVEAAQGLVPGAEEAVARSDRERAARIRFLYDVGWDEPLHYDLVLNTARLDVPTAVGLIRAALGAERFRATPASLAEVRDRSLTARIRAALLAHPETRDLTVFFSAERGHVTLSGRVGHDRQRQVTEQVVRALPGVARLASELVVLQPPPAPPAA
jgi:cytidylate kinase